MWKAIIKSKSVVSGVLTVVVDFFGENGQQFADQFQTTQAQPENWLEQQIKAKLGHLNALPALHDSIEVGKEIVHDESAKILSEKDQYKADLVAFHKLVAAVQQGFMKADNADFLALKQKLTDNFKTEYADLF